MFSRATMPLPQMQPFSVRVVLGPVKIRPYMPLPPPADRPVLCARGETCSFQVVVTATGEDLAEVDISMSDLAAAGGSAVIHSSGRGGRATIYRESFLSVFYRSSAQGDLGEWPDALIPRETGAPEEATNAFPTDVQLISPAYKRYRADRGRSLMDRCGTGAAVSAGRFAGNTAQRYVVEIVKPGPLGVATFRWRGDLGSAQAAAERTTSAHELPLDAGVRVAFRGNGRDDDFLAGDEFWIFAGPARHLPVWVDIPISLTDPAGIYSGEIRATARGQTPQRFPVNLEVLDFELPSTSRLASTFQMSWGGVAAAHFGDHLANWRKEQERMVQLGKAYAAAALRNGITLAPDGDITPDYKFNSDGSLAHADYSLYDSAVADFMDGTEATRGARWTSLPLPRLDRLTDSQRITALRDFIGHARERGWYDRLYDYTYDEPNAPRDFLALKVRARLIQEVDPAIPRLVTVSLRPELFGVVTRWCPLVNDLDPKPGSLRARWTQARGPRRENYDARLQAGDSLWWYQSCRSHSCLGNGPSPEYDNWPSYMIDASAVANRVFGFLSVVTNRVSGILYWDVAFADYPSGAPHRSPLSPWDSQYYFGGNGDGSLFYPGTPDRVGGHRQIPIESLRLKMIRDSFYDAEYALFLRRIGEEDFLQREVGRVLTNAWQWNADPQAWLELRQRLGKRIALKTAHAQQ